ncbi:MAG TPA: GNAT family N-acetyltransferase [Acidimicrobiales bacterium]|nr:GNAT family N-acetyltransferase [Acidimicrobiales bacterium]
MDSTYPGPVPATPLRTAAGLELTVAEAGPEDHEELYAAFAAVVAAGEGYPQPVGPLPVADFEEYWLEHKSLVAVARHEGRLAGSYYLKPNFPGRAAHIANAGYFVVPALRGGGVGEALVRHSFEEARRLGFDAMQFNLVFESNPARRLYERLGFQAVGRIPEAVEGEDAIVYWRRL